MSVRGITGLTRASRLVDEIGWLVDEYRKGREQRSALGRVTPVMPLAPVVNGSFPAVGHAVRAQDESAEDRRNG